MTSGFRVSGTLAKRLEELGFAPADVLHSSLELDQTAWEGSSPGDWRARNAGRRRPGSGAQVRVGAGRD